MIGGDSAHTRATARHHITYLSQRNKWTPQLPPPFLRRNLRDILDSHERQLRASVDVSARQDIMATRSQTWGWDFPTTAMLENLMQAGEKPVLNVEALQLRKPGTRTTIKKSRQDHSYDATEPDWLPHHHASSMWECKVDVAVSIPRDTQHSKRQLQFESLHATVHTYKSKEHDVYFDIRLKRPFFIAIEHLFVVTDSGTNGVRTWKRTTTAPYLLELSIHCDDVDRASNFLGTLEGRDPATYRDAPSNELVLKTSWEQLPTCPQEDQLLSLRRSKGHRSLELDYKVEIAAGWINRREHPLKWYNNAYNLTTGGRSQLLTPSASDDSDKMTKHYKITWHYRDGTGTRAMSADALTCALCQDDRHFTTFGHLVLHCRREHDHFLFDVKGAENKSDPTLFSAKIRVELAPDQEDGDREISDSDDREMEWVAPNRPFDMQAYMEGKDNWIGSTAAKNPTTSHDDQPRPKIKRGIARPLKRKQTTQISAILPPSKRPALEDVPDLPAHRPKKHRVPHVPGVTFYRTISKQPIEQGSYVAESDDEIDESWLEESQSRALEDMGITGGEKEFTKLFNQHLGREQSGSSVLLRETLVRFIRNNRRELQDEQWLQAFQSRLTMLRKGGVIDLKLETTCLQMVQNLKQPDGPSGSSTSPDDGDALPNGTVTRSKGTTTSSQYVSPNGAPSTSNYTSIGAALGTFGNLGSALSEIDRPAMHERKKPGKPAPYNSLLRLRRPTEDQNEHEHDHVHSNGIRGSGLPPYNSSQPTNGISAFHPTGITPAQATFPPAAAAAAAQGGQGKAGELAAPAPVKKSKRSICVCGERVTESRGTIACGNVDCERRDFHMKCVGLLQRESGWWCPEC